MSIQARAIVSVRVATLDEDRDLVVTQVHHFFPAWTDHNDVTQWGAYAGAIRDVFGGVSGGANAFPIYAGRLCTIKCYDMSDQKPRPVKAEVQHTPGTPEAGALMPREVAVPLRFYANRNVPRMRGRIYVGPFLASTSAEIVPPALARNVLNLGTQLHAINVNGGCQWQMFSPTDNTYRTITNQWVNDQWAHVTSRERAEISRWADVLP